MCSFLYTVTYKSYYKRYVVSRLIGTKIDTFIVYSFPVTAITNNHELGGLHNVHLFSYSSVGQKSVSLGQDQGVSRTALFPEALERIHFLAFAASGSCLLSLVHGPLLHLQSQWHSVLLQWWLRLPLLCQISPCFLLLRTGVTALRPHWTSQNNLPISRFLITSFVI